MGIYRVFRKRCWLNIQKHGPICCAILKQLLIPTTTLLIIYHLIRASIDLNMVKNTSSMREQGHQLRPNIDYIIWKIQNKLLETTPFDSKNLLPPFYRYVEKFEVSSKYKLSICSIPKVLSTFGTSLICYLKNAAKFKANGRRISTEKWATSFCSKRYVANNYTNSERELGSTRIAFIREPIDRFLSGFVNKCILKTAHENDSCFGCGANLNCFVEAFRKHLWEIYENKDLIHRLLIANSLAPQSWYCNFKEHIHDYIFIQYRNQSDGIVKMATELYNVLEYARIPKDLRDEITTSLLDGKSHHSTYSTYDRRKAAENLYSNVTLLKIVTELYYYDFIIFNFQLPTSFLISSVSS